jgi:hypothetical protein
MPAFRKVILSKDLERGDAIAPARAPVEPALATEPRPRTGDAL